MRKSLYIFSFLLILPLSVLKAQDFDNDSIIFAERAYYYQKYRSVRDTMRINTWLNLKRVSDNLEQVVKRDQQVIDGLRNKLVADSLIISNLRDVSRQFDTTKMQNETLLAELDDQKSLSFYYKIIIGGLSVIGLVLIIALIGKHRHYKNFKVSSDHYEALVEEKQHQLDMLDAELRKQKQREIDFREELEKGIQTYQVRLQKLKEKCEQLENENLQLRKLSAGSEDLLTSAPTDGIPAAELSDNIDDLKQLIKSLSDERNSLMNLAGKLQIKAENEGKK
ncbi:MAG: hypothetical protein HGA37_04975, partial [Lentimicrobium sp.]|nr:hypothetical protein [Lentimicrobium sp.]